MTPEQVKEVDEKIEMLHNSGIEFQMTAVALLEMMLTAEDAEEMKGEIQWYAQITEAITMGDVKNVTDEEKLQFLVMNDALIGIYEKRNKL